jgi:hypothetical protein
MKPVSTLVAVFDDGSIYADSRIKSEVELSSIVQSRGRCQIVRGKVQEWQKRSLPANALFHEWCKTLSGHTGEDPDSTKQILKIKFGFYQIISGDDDAARQLDWMLRELDFWRRKWENQIKIARMIPCTSIMSTKQMKAFMDTVKDWAMNEFNITLDNGKRD